MKWQIQISISIKSDSVNYSFSHAPPENDLNMKNRDGINPSISLVDGILLSNGDVHTEKVT